MPTLLRPRELWELDRPFSEFFRTLSGPWPFQPLLGLMPGKHFIPSSDVFARNGDLVVRLDLPGMDLKNIHIQYAEGELVVTGERKEVKEIKEEDYFRKESFYGTFERHLPLPKEIKESDIKATYDNGVLEIVMPKVAPSNGKAHPKEIVIKGTHKL